MIFLYYQDGKCNLDCVIHSKLLYYIFEPPFSGGFFRRKMKYRQLSKEQFLALHKEFAQFLATQQIDNDEWETINKEKPEMADEELNIFSYVVWEKVLTKTKYLEHISENHINLFKCNSTEIDRIYIRLNDTKRNFLHAQDYGWFLNNLRDDTVEYFSASKKYAKERNLEIFDLIEMGSQISKGVLYNTIIELIR